MRQALSRQAEYELIDFLFRSDVNAARRFVEKQHPGTGRQPLADGDLLLVAAGQRRDDLIDPIAAHGELLDHVRGELSLAGEAAHAETRRRAD